jgi:hypothetical protein
MALVLCTILGETLFITPSQNIERRYTDTSTIHWGTTSLIYIWYRVTDRTTKGNTYPPRARWKTDRREPMIITRDGGRHRKWGLWHASIPPVSLLRLQSIQVFNKSVLNKIQTITVTCQVNLCDATFDPRHLPCGVYRP